MDIDDITDVREAVNRQMASRLAIDRDNLIREVLGRYLGDPDFDPMSLAGRLHCMIFPSKVEVMMIDGVELIEFHPTSMVLEGTKLTARFNYRVLYQPAKDSP